MLKTTGLFVASVLRVDNNEVVGSGGGARAESGGSVDGLDASRKSWTEIGLNCTEFPEDKEGVHPSYRPQRAGLIVKEASIKVPVKYANFAFSQDLASELHKYTGINNYAIKLVDANGFIRPSKSSAGAPIFFN